MVPFEDPETTTTLESKAHHLKAASVADSWWMGQERQTARIVALSNRIGNRPYFAVDYASGKRGWLSYHLANEWITNSPGGLSSIGKVFAMEVAIVAVDVQALECGRQQRGRSLVRRRGKDSPMARRP